MEKLPSAAQGVRHTANFQQIPPVKGRAPHSVSRIPPLVLILCFLAPLSPCARAATGTKTMVVTPDARATGVALEVLKQGGNAIDAAVAAAWMLNVVEPQASGIGGSGSLLFYDIGTKRILFFDGSAKAPAKASPRMFLDPSSKQLLSDEAVKTGGLAVGVPGLLKMTEEVHAQYGTRKFPFAKLLDPAALAAENGTEVSIALARSIGENAGRLTRCDPKGTTFFKGGIPLEAGDLLVQPELAKAFRMIQKKGAAAFYEGAISDSIVRVVKKNACRPGLLRARDLKNYSAAQRDPVHAVYQTYDLFSAGPPADGGVMLFRALNILSNFGVSGFGQSPETYHLLGEAQKLAFAHHTGVADPDLFNVPVPELLSEAWAKDRSSGVLFDKALTTTEEWGDAQKVRSSIMVLDPRGNIAILSLTLGDAFGSALKVPEYGFFLNDLLAAFAVDPTTVRSPQSAELISGGQRPRGEEAPVILFREGKPVAFLDAYGAGDPAAVLLNVLIQIIDLKVPCAEAVAASRLIARGRVIEIEPGLYGEGNVRLKLELLGHETRKKDKIGSAQIIFWEPVSLKIIGESDPRSGGEAAGF